MQLIVAIFCTDQPARRSGADPDRHNLASRRDGEHRAQGDDLDIKPPDSSAPDGPQTCWQQISGHPSGAPILICPAN